jgi:hypothetical protein
MLALVGVIPFFEIIRVNIPPECAETFGPTNANARIKSVIVMVEVSLHCIFLKIRYSINKR